VASRISATGAASLSRGPQPVTAHPAKLSLQRSCHERGEIAGLQGGTRHRRRAGAAPASALMVIARRLEKTILRAPAGGVVSVIFAEVGEAVRAGQPVLAIEESASSGCRSTRGKICCTASCWERRSRSRGRARNGAGRRHRAAAARPVRDLACRASGRRSRSQHAAPAPPSARRCDRLRAWHDGLAASLRGRI
jgi:hypothetical protein